MKYFCLCLWFVLLFNLPGNGQKLSPKEVDLEEFIETMFPMPDDDVNYEDLYESLYQYYLTPFDLNSATREELQALYLLSELQINSLLSYRNTAGAFKSIYELQVVPNLELRDIYKILPFVVVHEPGFGQGSKGLIKRVLSEKNNYFLLRYERSLEKKKGYSTSESPETSRYTGSPDKVYGKFRVSHTRDFSMGFTFEKDAGEPIEWNPGKQWYGVDFWSGHIMLQNKGIIKSLIFGDYQIQAGQGLVLASGFGMGKGAEPITTVRRNNLGVRPYTSALEAGFFRGGAVTFKKNSFEATPFISIRKADGSVQPVDTAESSDQILSSIQSTGLHRTPAELQKRQSITEHAAGVNMIFSSVDGRFNIGGNCMSTWYSLYMQPQQKVYNQFEFRGKNNTIVGVFSDYNWQNFNFFGEAARSQSGGIGLVAGYIASLSRNIEMSMVYRKYERNFHSFYASAFGENTRNINETGVYTGTKFKPSGNITVSAYFDLFKFPWLKYRVNSPSSGYEFLSRILYQPTKKVEIYGQYREESKGTNISEGDSKIYLIGNGVKKNYSINFSYSPEVFLDMQSRIQYTTYNLGDNYSEGFAIIQDAGVNFGRFKINARYCLFDTDDYNSRQYVYEKNVLYAFSLPAYYGEGVRTFLMVQCKLNKSLTFWVRAAQSRFIDRSKIGSGLEEIEGRKRTDVSCQLRYVLL